jgi:8-oxo-dGTP diphosphatase
MNMTKEYVKIFVAADVILEKDYRYLLVQEKKVESFGLWGIPGGRVEAGETIKETAVREVKEETGYSIRLAGQVGIYHAEGDDQVRHVFAGEIADGDLVFPSDEILDAQWYSFEEIEAIKNKLRGPWVLEAIMQYEENFKNFV